MNGRIGDRDENADIAAGMQRGRWGEDSTFTSRKFAEPPGIRSIRNRGQYLVRACYCPTEPFLWTRPPWKKRCWTMLWPSRRKRTA